MLRRSITIIAVICLLLGACFWTIRLAWAEHLFNSGDLQSVSKAIELAPCNDRYLVGLAELMDRAGDDPRPMLAAASNLNPYDASIRIELGLLEEIRNRHQEAEDLLLTAARMNRKYAPRWTLANYYFRRGETDNFMQWAREALQVSYGDRRPLFDLCWSMKPEPDTILLRAIPARRPVQRDFANYLIARQQYSSAEPLLIELVKSVSEPETAYFLGITDHLLRLGRFPAAITIWNSLCNMGLLQYTPLRPGTEAVLTNFNFSFPALGHGFDWLVPTTTGVFVTQMPPPEGWKISLSGDQPEQCEIISQYLPLEIGRRYRLTYRYRSAPSSLTMGTPDSGIRWRLHTALGRTEIAESDPLTSNETSEDSFSFTLPNNSSGARLTLAYERASGTMRTEATITLEQLRIELVE